jgi:hypothetical protein
VRRKKQNFLTAAKYLASLSFKYNESFYLSARWKDPNGVLLMNLLTDATSIVDPDPDIRIRIRIQEGNESQK